MMEVDQVKMAGQMNLSHLSDEECQQILSVIQRDFNLRQQEKQRLEELEAEIKQEKLRSEILSKGQTFNDNCCVRCFSQFYMFFNPKVQCVTCKFNVCKKCSIYKNKEKEYVCSLCTKQEELETLSNKWFYSNVAERFDRFGGANVVRMIHKKKTESDVDSDSGYPPTDSSTFDAATKQPPLSAVESAKEEQRPIGFTETDERENILVKLRQRLDAIEKNLQQLHLQENQKELDHQSSFYRSSILQNMTNVKALLVSVAKQLASNMNSTDSDDSSEEPANHEQQEAIAKRLLQDAVNQLYSSPPFESTVNNGEEPFAFIDPATLTLDAYTKRLSEAIFNKINEDRHWSNGKISEELEDDLEHQRRSGTLLPRSSQFSDSENEDLRATTDSMSDVDVRERVIWSKSIDSNLSRSESHSRMSLNSSQNEFEEPACFIQSQDLTEKLAAVNQSEMPSTASQFSIESETINIHKLSNCSSHDEEHFLRQSDHENQSIHQSDHENISIHQSDDEKQSNVTINRTSIEINSPNLEIQNRATSLFSNTETPEEVYEQSLKKIDDSNNPTPVAISVTTDESSGDEETYSPKGLKYDIAEYDVTPDSLWAFTSRKKEMLVLPALDDDCSVSMLPDPDLDLAAAGRGSNTWSFRNAYDLSDTDSLSVTNDDSDLDEEEERKQMWFTESEKRAKIDDDIRIKMIPQDSSVQTDDLAFESMLNSRERQTGSEISVQRREQTDSGVQTLDDETDRPSFENAECDAVDFPDGNEDLKARFQDVPQDVIISAGQSFRSKACLTGKKPMDVFWFHESSRLDFDERCTIAHKGNVHSLEMVDVQMADDGHYVCIGVNEHGRCSHTFHVSVMDPETFHQTGEKHFKASTLERKGRDHNHQWQRTTATSSSTAENLLDRSSPDVHSSVSSHVETVRHENRSHVNISLSPDITPPDITPPDITPPDITPPDITPLDIAASEITAVDMTILPGDHVDAIVSHDLVLTAVNNQETQDVSNSADDDDDVFKKTDEMFQKRTSTEEKVNLPLDHSLAPIPYPAANLQSLSYLDHDLMSFNGPDSEPDDGKVVLNLSFSDFERLYESRVLTPSQLKTSRFTPDEVLRIQKILDKPDDATNDKDSESGNEETASLVKVFHGKIPDVTSRLYGRDYVINDAIARHEKNLGQNRTGSSYSVSSHDHKISDFESDDLSRNSSHVMQAKIVQPHLMTSPKVHQQPEVSYSRSHAPDVFALNHKTVSKPEESSTIHIPPFPIRSSPVEPSSILSHHQDDSATVSSLSQRGNDDGERGSDDEAVAAETGSDAANLPSVKSLRMLFNANSSTPEESNFTRVYSLTARDLPNSVVAQRLRARKEEKARLQHLSLVSEQSGDDHRRRYDSCSSPNRDD